MQTQNTNTNDRPKQGEKPRARKNKRRGGGGEVTRREGSRNLGKRVRESEDKIWSYGRPVELGLYFVVSRLPAGRANRRLAIIPEPRARHCINCRSSFDILIVYVIYVFQILFGVVYWVER
ncbi:hypothetical protein Scep_004292 [Stephania cephalantha]|uniref:Uncharacterized protein n=1 Tax=Stephania cephalantha TaxID=152367 RepID=A0AAP0PVA6_9MAGN